LAEGERAPLTTMRILVDGDGAGRREIIFAQAMEFGAEVHWVNNYSQDAPGMREGLRLWTHMADKQSQAVDIILMNLARRGDLVITADLGLACVVIAKGAAALSPRGQWFREEQVKQQMEFRHLRAERKRSGENTGGGPKPQRREDEQRFEDELRHALKGEHVSP